jgi:hypothetical protein
MTSTPAADLPDSDADMQTAASRLKRARYAGSGERLAREPDLTILIDDQPMPTAPVFWRASPGTLQPAYDRSSTSNELQADGIGKGARCSSMGDGPGSTSLHLPHAATYDIDRVATPRGWPITSER